MVITYDDIDNIIWGINEDIEDGYCTEKDPWIWLDSVGGYYYYDPGGGRPHYVVRFYEIDHGTADCANDFFEEEEG